MIDFTLATQKSEIMETLAALLEIESVKSKPQTLMPYGRGIFDALMTMLGLADNDMDFDSVNLFSHLGYIEYGEGEEMLAILTHLDVVPAGDGWTVPPFAATVKDGKIYGRGALDNKGPAVAALFALRAIKENCITLNKRVRLIFGCDEESGWADMEFYKNNGGEVPTMSFSPDAAFPIVNSEKGLMQISLKKKAYDAPQSPSTAILSINGGTRVNVVPDFCECILSESSEAIETLVDLYNENAEVKIELEQQGDILRLTATGVSAHGSRPEHGKNAVASMIVFLNSLPLAKNYLSDAVYQLAKYIGLETDGKSMGLYCGDESGMLTLNLGYFKTKEDVLDVGVDIRYPVHTNGNVVMRALLKHLNEFNVEVAFSKPANFVSEDSELVQGLKQAYEEIMGEPATCMSMGGATYARAFPNSVAFGPVFPGQEGTEHQADEYIEIDSLIKLADIIANAVVILCSD